MGGLNLTSSKNMEDDLRVRLQLLGSGSAIFRGFGTGDSGCDELGHCYGNYQKCKKKCTLRSFPMKIASS